VLHLLANKRFYYYYYHHYYYNSTFSAAGKSSMPFHRVGCNCDFYMNMICYSMLECNSRRCYNSSDASVRVVNNWNSDIVVQGTGRLVVFSGNLVADGTCICNLINRCGVATTVFLYIGWNNQTKPDMLSTSYTVVRLH